jgi:hypothetical protein
MVQGTIWMQTPDTTKEQNVTTTFMEGYITLLYVVLTELSAVFQLYHGDQF